MSGGLDITCKKCGDVVARTCNLISRSMPEWSGKYVKTLDEGGKKRTITIHQVKVTKTGKIIEIITVSRANVKMVHDGVVSSNTWFGVDTDYANCTACGARVGWVVNSKSTCYGFPLHRVDVDGLEM